MREINEGAQPRETERRCHTDLAVESVNGSFRRCAQMLQRVVSLVARAAHCCLLALASTPVTGVVATRSIHEDLLE